jgi:RHS repeat-associated protein
VCDTENQTGTLIDFTFRRYSPTQGRWISPDPAGLAAVDPTNPQTWNRYAYVMNQPLRFTDPLGLWAGGPGFYSADIGTTIGCPVPSRFVRRGGYHGRRQRSGYATRS